MLSLSRARPRAHRGRRARAALRCGARPRTRHAPQPDHTERKGWNDKFSFCAFDIAVPGTCKLKVHYAVQSTDADVESPEQYRVYTGDHWGMWEHKFDFYAYPAPVVQLDPQS